MGEDKWEVEKGSAGHQDQDMQSLLFLIVWISLQMYWKAVGGFKLGECKMCSKILLWLLCREWMAGGKSGRGHQVGSFFVFRQEKMVSWIWEVGIGG